MHFSNFISQPPPAQTMVQALELLYALGGEKQGCQQGGKVKRETVLQLETSVQNSVSASIYKLKVSLRMMQNLNQLRVFWQVWTITAV